ncbi:Ankyrin repeat and EF-hand domain-containing protein 1-like [Oopsacas minuta]|uniref:Ankyrin repeat and EF-hand domain-containing protein 1-like n=1 Tax=Oopsacas minuta TaxID=111878 RepID=A0AAV7JW39_9METZ|nr:Ankyrin repeat and EF-hand domain-containing protein 1-like [Oopsacas minuta]
MPCANSRLEVLQVKKLAQAIRNNDANQLYKMLLYGVPGLLNLQDPLTGEAALHVAVRYNYDQLTGILLEQGADINLEAKEGVRPIMVAADYGHIQSLDTLLEKGAEVKSLDATGSNVLFYCLKSTNRHCVCIEKLLEAGADPNQVRSSDGFPVLLAACQAGESKAAEILLAKGASANSCIKKSGKTALMISSEAGHSECVRVLAHAGADLQAADSRGWTSAHYASQSRSFGVLTTLSGYRADFSVTSHPDHNTPLHLAASLPDQLTCKFLAQRGAPCSQENTEGLLAKQIALSLGSKAIGKDLKKLGDQQDKVLSGGNPKGYSEAWLVQLYDWIQVNKYDLYTQLKKVDVEGKGELSKPELINCLLEVGAPAEKDELENLLNLLTKNKDIPVPFKTFLQENKYLHFSYKISANDLTGKSQKGKKGKKGKKGGKKGKKLKIPFDIPITPKSGPRPDIPDHMILKEEYCSDPIRFPRDAPVSNPSQDDSHWYMPEPDKQYLNIYDAVKQADFVSLESALTRGIATTEIRDKFNKTPLMMACAHGRIDVVDWLLERGADVNAFDNFLWRPIHHASHAGHINIVQRLIESGADINTQTIHGGTSLMRAMESSKIDLVKLLLDRGAKTDLRNKSGKTALDIAYEWGDSDTLLVARGLIKEEKQEEKAGKGEKKGKKKEKKGKGKKEKGKKKGKGEDEDDAMPKLTPDQISVLAPKTNPPARLPTPMEKIDLLRHSLNPGNTITPGSTLPSVNKPPTAWGSRPPSTQEFLKRQQSLRESQGEDVVDFGEIRSPFTISIDARVKHMDTEDL